jgi:hydrogenase maturation protease
MHAGARALPGPKLNSQTYFQPPPAKAPRRKNRVLVLGLGNDILSDDAVGLHVAREIQQRLRDTDGIEVQESSEMGLALLDYVVGFDDLVLVDAVQTGQAPPGFLHELDDSELKVLPIVSPHFLGVGEVMALGRRLGLPVPGRVRIFAIEVEDPFTVGVRMTPPLRRILVSIASRVLAAARQLNLKKQSKPQMNTDRHRAEGVTKKRESANE